MSAKQNWDAELYEARHSFVWQLGQGVLDLLAPQAGERILDLGSGTGPLTQKIADTGADVLGVDASPEMVAQARQNYPHLKFALDDATKLTFNSEFDAVFSNATLHWVKDARTAAECIARALKKGGRFVAEFGGKGNIAQIEGAVRSAIRKYVDAVPESRTYFPSLGEYAAVMEGVRLEPQFLQLFDRPTPLEGEAGMQNWIRQFAWYYFEAVPKELRQKALTETVETLRPNLYRDGSWFADYRRLRIIAVK